MSKVTVIGAGNVGATCANVLVTNQVADEVVLLDMSDKRVSYHSVFHKVSVNRTRNRGIMPGHFIGLPKFPSLVYFLLFYGCISR